MIATLRLALILILLPLIAVADITGTATVTDGDTIKINGQRIRLHGIDAPEKKQLCYDEGRRWQCGKDAGCILSDFIAKRLVRCVERDRDRYRRIVAVCYVGEVDLNAWMVSKGLAVAYRRYSRDYVDEERLAKKSKAGIWGTEFVLPWEWRRGKRLAR